MHGYRNVAYAYIPRIWNIGFKIPYKRHADAAKMEKGVNERGGFHMSRCGIRFVLQLQILRMR